MMQESQANVFAVMKIHVNILKALDCLKMMVTSMDLHGYIEKSKKMI